MCHRSTACILYHLSFKLSTPFRKLFRHFSIFSDLSHFGPAFFDPFYTFSFTSCKIPTDKVQKPPRRRLRGEAFFQKANALPDARSNAPPPFSARRAESYALSDIPSERGIHITSYYMLHAHPRSRCPPLSDATSESRTSPKQRPSYTPSQLPYYYM